MLHVFHWPRKRSGNKNASNTEPHSSRLRHDLATTPQHHPKKLHKKYNVHSQSPLSYYIISKLYRMVIKFSVALSGT